MLVSAADLKTAFLALSPTTNSTEGVTAFVGVVANFMDQVQAGPTGTPGIFTLNQSVMIPLILAMPPVSDDSWISNFVSAWQTSVSASTITPGTVTESVWVGSGGLDIATLPSAATTITTIAAAAATLESGLNLVGAASDQTLQLATAIRDATLAFVFNCIGLAAPPPLTPIPIPLSAE